MHMCELVSEGQRSTSGTLLLYTLLFKSSSLNLELMDFTRLVDPIRPGSEIHVIMANFSTGARDPDSGPYACTAGPLLTEPSPQALELIFIKLANYEICYKKS